MTKSKELSAAQTVKIAQLFAENLKRDIRSLQPPGNPNNIFLALEFFTAAQTKGNLGSNDNDLIQATAHALKIPKSYWEKRASWVDWALITREAMFKADDSFQNAFYHAEAVVINEQTTIKAGVDPEKNRAARAKIQKALVVLEGKLNLFRQDSIGNETKLEDQLIIAESFALLAENIEGEDSYDLKKKFALLSIGEFRTYHAMSENELASDEFLRQQYPYFDKALEILERLEVSPSYSRAVFRSYQGSNPYPQPSASNP